MTQWQREHPKSAWQPAVRIITIACFPVTIACKSALENLLASSHDKIRYSSNAHCGHINFWDNHDDSDNSIYYTFFSQALDAWVPKETECRRENNVLTIHLRACIAASDLHFLAYFRSAGTWGERPGSEQLVKDTWGDAHRDTRA